MARPLRIEYEGAFYHVTARGNERRNIYYSKSDYERFKQYLIEAKKKYNCIIHCYVLMGNHYHLLIETPDANLNKIMHYVNGSYTTYINIRRNRSGHLFQGRYKAILVDKDSYIMELSRYIHLNPVRAKITEKPEDYPYSSYNSYILGGKENIISEDFILSMLSKEKGEARKKYKAFTENAIGLEIEAPKAYGGMILGGHEFIRETLKRLKKNYLQNEEISSRKALKSSKGIGDILDSVSEYFRVSKEDALKDRRDAIRKVAIYLMKEYSGAKNKQIGELMGNISYSAVAKTYQRFKKKIEKDTGLRKRINKIEAYLSFVKG